MGREPGTLPKNVLRELAPSLIVVCGFLVSYSLWDVMAVGMAKAQRGFLHMSCNEIPSQLPEEVYLAQRVQTNQIEQLPVFLVGIFGCALLVNGKVAGILGLIWCILRRLYASAYRKAVGVPLESVGLSQYTVPCYFLSNGMLMATAVQSLRVMLSQN